MAPCLLKVTPIRLQGSYPTLRFVPGTSTSTASPRAKPAKLFSSSKSYTSFCKRPKRAPSIIPVCAFISFNKAVGLRADVGDEFAHRVRVHLVLQDGIGQQLDGGQRRLELVGRVRDELALGDLRLLELVGELVELGGERGVFVRAAHLDLVAVFALAHKPHGGQDLPHTPRARHGKDDRAQKQDADQHQRAAEDRPLEARDDAALRGVVFHHIHAADHRIMCEDGRGGVAFEGMVLIDAAEDVVTFERLHDLLQQDHLARRALAGHGIIERPARRVGDEQARDVHVADDGDDLLRRLLRQGVDAGKGGRHDLQLILRGRAFGLEHQIPGGPGGIDIQEHQHQHRDRHIRQRIAQLRAGRHQPDAPFST